jgi:iron complex outermembrane recepter protein
VSQVGAAVLLALTLDSAVIADDIASTDTTEFNISATHLAEALSKFGAQTGMQVVYSPELVRGLKAHALAGRHTVEAGLRELLTGTGLHWSYVNDNTIVLKRAGDNSAADGDDKKTSMTKTSQVIVAGTRPLDQVVVEGSRPAAFTDANVDLPRTMDDVQPYYVFDVAAIEQSGALNVEEFLKNSLTMNTTVVSSNQKVPTINTATTVGAGINLRGLGTDHTLVLVNGRRMAGVNFNGADNAQPDLNGIPFSAIERIEILPSSASGIYGGSAVGGVVNIILKQRYSGSEVRARYDNTWDIATPRRTVSATWGHAFEDDRTQLMLTADWSDWQP